MYIYIYKICTLYIKELLLKHGNRQILSLNHLKMHIAEL